MSHSKPARLFHRASPPHISTLILISGLSALSMNIFLPSLPNMATYFQADYALLQLSIALYLAVNGAMQIIIGPISDKLGRRPVILGGFALFVLATIGCIFAPNAQVFLFFRMCQAVVAVGITLSRAAVRDMYPQDQAASMIGYVTMGMAVVPMIAPMVGGALEESFGWKASFWLMTGLGTAAFAMVWADLGETAQGSGKTLLEQFREYPELLTSTRFWGYAMASALSSGTFFAYLGGAPYVGTQIFGMSPADLGFFFGAPAVGYFLGNYITGRFSTRIGLNRMIQWGNFGNCAGVLLSLGFFLIGHGSPYTFFGCMTLIGIGNGMSIPNATAGMLSVRPHLAGTASGLGGAIMLMGGAGLSALAGALLGPKFGVYTLLGIMLLSAITGVIAILMVLRRERALGL